MLKNKKVLTLAMIGGLTLGGLSVATVASAQGYGGDAGEAQTDENVETQDADTNDAGALVQVQDEADTDEADTDGETEGRRGNRGGCNLETAAEAIGIEEADLRAALEDGDTIADVAEANGVSADDVIDALVDAKADRIAEKVEEGSITQEEADEKLANYESKISDRVNGVDDTDDDTDEV